MVAPIRRRLLGQPPAYALLYGSDRPLDLAIGLTVAWRDPVVSYTQRITKSMKASLKLRTVVRTDVPGLAPADN